MADKLRAIAHTIASTLNGEHATAWRTYAPERAAPVELGCGVTRSGWRVIREDQGRHRGLAFGRRELAYGGQRLWWVVDDGHGIVEARDASKGPTSLVREMWPYVNELLTDPVVALREALDRRGLAEHLGEPRQTGGGWKMGDRVWFIIDPDPVTGERWPYVEVESALDRRVYRLRRRGTVRQLAAALAAVGHQIATHRKPGPLFGLATSYPNAAPPAEVMAVITGRAAPVADWASRLRSTVLNVESAGDLRRRRATAAKRADVVLTLPKLDPTDRIAVPSAVIGALWGLGLGVRLIADVTTGAQSAKSSINRRLKHLRDGWPDVGPSWRPEPNNGEQLTADALARRLAEWAVDPQPELTGQTVPPAQPGQQSGTPKIRVRRRVSESEPAESDSEHPTPSRRVPSGSPASPAGTVADQKVEDFVANLPRRMQTFLTTLARRGSISLDDCMKALDLPSARALGGITGSIRRWAPVRAVPIPFEKRGGSEYFVWMGESLPGWARWTDDARNERPAAKLEDDGGTWGGVDLPPELEHVVKAMPVNRRRLGRKVLAVLVWQRQQTEAALPLADVARVLSAPRPDVEGVISAAGPAVSSGPDGVRLAA